MITKLTIENFKAIEHLEVNLGDFSILIGENSCGKSTVLQALDLLCSIAVRDIDEYLNDREWEFEEIRSQFARPGEGMAFSLAYDDGARELVWAIEIDRRDDRWDIEESVTVLGTGEVLLSFGRSDQDVPLDFSQMNLKSSALKMLDSHKAMIAASAYDESLVRLKSALASSSSFELLSPDKMRRGSRGQVESIGMGGERLAAYIHGLPSTRKSELSALVSEFLGNEVKVTTTTKGRPGWIDLSLEETWKGGQTKVEKRYLSDGLLRIIAFSAILVGYGKVPSSAAKSSGWAGGLILLDEIEDGINPELAEMLITRFKRLAQSSSFQVVVTSHSPIMVNYADPADIVYLWRDDDGSVHADSLFQSAFLDKLLEIFNPGEVWLNFTKEDIVRKIRGEAGERA